MTTDTPIITTQADANRLIPELLRAGTREICVTPREAIDLTRVEMVDDYTGETARFNALSAKLDDGLYFDGDGETCRCISTLRIVPPTGPDAWPMHPDWVRSLRDQCVAAGVRPVFEGWGEWVDYGTAKELAVKAAITDGVIDPVTLRHFKHPGRGLIDWGVGPSGEQAWIHVDGRIFPDAQACFDAGLTTIEAMRQVANMVRVGRDRSGRLLDGRTWE